MNDMGTIGDLTADAAPARTTPVMAQFLEIKAAHPG